MRITFSSPLVNRTAKERSAFTLTTKFWDDSTETWSANTPSSVKYRIDSLEGCSVILDWTSATPGTSAALAISATQNAIIDNAKQRERKQVTVKINDGLASQWQDTFDYWVENLVGQT